MSMSTNVIGFAPPDDDWRKMKAVWDACTMAKLPIPPEVDKFFNGEEPDDVGVKIPLRYPMHESVREYSADMREGFDIDLSKLPKQVKILRFYNSF